MANSVLASANHLMYWLGINERSKHLIAMELEIHIL